MNEQERDTADGVIRIEAESPVAVGWPTATSVPVTPVATPLVADVAAQPDGDETDTAELRAEIEETRAALSDTLSAIEEQLSPQRLMEQAKDTVQETTEHVVAQAKHAAHEAMVDAVDHTKEVVHDATIGKVEHMVSNVTDAAKNLVGGAAGTAHADAETAYYGAGTGSTTTSYGTAVTAQPTSGTGATLWETLKENPIPTALAAASLGWLFAHRANRAKSAASQTSSASYPRPLSQGPDTVRVTGDRESLPDKAGQVAGQVGSTVGDTAATLHDKAGQVTDQVGGAVGATVSQVQDTAGQVAGQAQQAASGFAQGTQQAASGLIQGTQQAASGLVQGTQGQAQRAQNQFQRVLHENPLAVGAAGLALGAAIGLAIPETQRENWLLGEARDSVMDKAVGTAQDTVQKVGTIARKAEGAAEDAIKNEAHTQGLTPS